MLRLLLSEVEVGDEELVDLCCVLLFELFKVGLCLFLDLASVLAGRTKHVYCVHQLGDVHFCNGKLI